MLRKLLGKSFQGIYGPDALTYTMLIISALLVNLPIVQLLGYLLFGYSLFRVFSKNKSKRIIELQKFNHATRGIRQKFQTIRFSMNNRIMQRKTHVFLKCPKCKNTLRLPRNKGRLQVTCPVCKNEFYKKT